VVGGRSPDLCLLATVLAAQQRNHVTRKSALLPGGCPFNQRFAEEAKEPGYAARGPGERPVGVEASGPAGPGSESGATGEALAKEGVPAETSPNGGRVHEGHGRLHPGTDGPPLSELLEMALSEERWEAFSRGSPIRRAGRAGFARNVCVALGNWLSGGVQPPEEALALLVQALSDPEPLVRGHAAWALGRAGTDEARFQLSALVSMEEHPWVREELALAEGR
jgi:hypothetical protein